MKQLSKLLVVLTLLTFIYIPATAQEVIPKTIETSFKAGNAEELAKHFNENIEIALLDKEDVYSKKQAIVIVKDFFTKFTPTSFAILHQGGKESKYAIGTLKSGDNTFRVYFLMKKTDGKWLMHQLRIESENE